jgi:hypothetical protein
MSLICVKKSALDLVMLGPIKDAKKKFFFLILYAATHSINQLLDYSVGDPGTFWCGSRFVDPYVPTSDVWIWIRLLSSMTLGMQKKRFFSYFFITYPQAHYLQS